MRTCSRALLLMGLLGSLLVSGCGPPTIIGGKTPARMPHTIISLSPGTTELTMLTVSVHLIGRSPADDFPPQIANVPIVVNANMKPDYEQIMSLKPDIIIYDQGLLSPSDVEKLKATNAQLMEIKGDTVSDFIKDLYLLGSMTISESSISDYIDRIKAQQTICQSEPFNPRPTAALIMTMPNSNPMVAGVHSFYADLVRTAGAEPVGPDSNKFDTMSIEALVALNPNVIIVATPTGDYSVLTKDPRLAQLTAVKKGSTWGFRRTTLFDGESVLMLLLKTCMRGLLA